MGDSLDEVEALIKKHEDFEKSLAAQEEKIKVRLLIAKTFVCRLSGNLGLKKTPNFSMIQCFVST